MTRFSWLIPRSTLGLTFVGFLLAALPLCVSTLTTILRIDQMAAIGQAAALRASTVNQQSRQLAESLTAMETALEEYAERDDRALYETFALRHAQLRVAAEELTTLHLGDAFDAEVNAFLAREQAFFEAQPASSDIQLSPSWRELSRHSRRLVDQGRELVEAEGMAAAEEAIAFERVLLVQALAVVPLSVILAIAFARLINRPIRQIDSAIRALAADSFHGSVEIQGPRDLQEVGACLDALRRRIAELEKEKSSFVRRISHELKTPLTTIRQGAELLADPAGTPPEQAAEIGELLKESSLELQRLIEDLLEFGKTQRLARDDMSVKSVDLKGLLQKVVGEHALALKSKRIRLEQSLVDVTVPGDSKRLRTAINNVLANAVKYTPPDGAISMQLKIDGGAAVIDVSDTGPGIAADERLRVFEP
ncbi:MAG TPA: histidine kinase dimerization/phospho-acceptor domain-containing protein, partial [Gammaproteobacteria bacterium]|nr:histidine kinase dimerization/phospho-acceptor domain-containing protein [Gammaproteobacteria bacterium]